MPAGFVLTCACTPNADVASHGVKPESITPNSDVIQAKVSIAQAEKLLSAKYQVFHHVSNCTIN